MSKIEALLQPLRQTVLSATRLAHNARSLALALSRDVVRDSGPVVRHARSFVLAAREQLAVAQTVARKELVSAREQLIGARNAARQELEAARLQLRNSGDPHVDA